MFDLNSRQLQQIKILRRAWIDGIGEIKIAVAIKLIGQQARPIGHRRGKIRRSQNVIRSIRQAARAG